MKQQEKPLSANVSLLTIEAPQLHTEKKVWVYLPAGYTSADDSYPVLYMHDGQNLFDRGTPYTGEKRGDEVLDELQLPLIVIGIEHGEEKRTDELTPYTNEKYGGGNGDAYLSEEIYKFTEEAEKINSKVYFMSGTNEGKSMVPNMERMVQILKPKLRNEDDVFIKIVKGGKHNEKLWSREMADALLWLME